MSILANRLKYVLSPQADIYKQMSEMVSGYVADIGCGLGFGSNMLLWKARMVCGYDVDTNCLDFARWCFPSIKFLKHDITTGPLPYIYDYIVLIDVIEHIEQDELVVKNVFSSLKPSGTAILSTPNRLSRYRKSENHIREYTPVELEKLLRTNFNDVKLMCYGWAPIKTGYESPIIALCRRNNNG